MSLAGELVEIPEDAYRYGVGSLKLRVITVESAPEDGWVVLVGHEIGWDGRRVALRSVVARESAIRRERVTR